MAGLIPAVALADLVKNRRFLRTLAKAGLGLAPLALCLAVTGMQLAGQDKGIHYLQVLAEERSFALWQDLRSHWEVMLASVSMPPSRKTAGGSQACAAGVQKPRSTSAAESAVTTNTQDRYYKLWGLDRVSPVGTVFTGPRHGSNRPLPAGTHHNRRVSPDRGLAPRAGEPEVRKRIPC